MKKKKASKTFKTQALQVEKSYKYSLILLLGVLLITIWSYSNTLDNEILNFDDNEYFENFPEILNFSISEIKTYFSKHYVLMYQPLPILSFALTYKFYGLTPAPYHITNIIFHLLNIILVFLFVRKITKSETAGLIAAFLFGVHPMNVEAVSWISARSSTMFSFFYLLALYSYLYYLRDTKIRYYLLMLVFFILSLFSKAHAVTLPLIIIAIDYFYHVKIDKKYIIEKIPLFILSLIFGLITILEEGTTTNLRHGIEKFTMIDNIFLLSYSLWFYIYRLFAPFNLCAIYVYPEKINGLLPYHYYIMPLIIMIIVYLIYRQRKNRMILFGIAFFILGISLTLQIIPSRLFIVTDRYTYLPYVGLLTILGYLAANVKNVLYKRYVYLGIIITGLFFSYLSYERNKVWANDMVFATDIINKNPQVPYLSRAYGVRGNYYLNVLKDIEKAFSDYSAAVSLDSSDNISLINKGNALLSLERFDEAIQVYNKAINIDTTHPMAYNNRGFAYAQIKANDFALEDYKKALNIFPEFFLTHDNIALLYFNMGLYEKALMHFDYLLNNMPVNPEQKSKLLFNRASSYYNLALVKEACSDWYEAHLLGFSEAKIRLDKYCK